LSAVTIWYQLKWSSPQKAAVAARLGGVPLVATKLPAIPVPLESTVIVPTFAPAGSGQWTSMEMGPAKVDTAAENIKAAVMNE
jgi:hypothetical protein